jgi:hypothetical protein
MKKSVAALALLVTVLACSPLLAQEAEDADNVEFQKLKVLEPILGIYHWAWSNDEGEHESLLTISWNVSKKAMIATRQARHADTKETLSLKPWIDQEDRVYYFWNHAEDRIESVRVAPYTAEYSINEVMAEGDGEFTLKFIRSTDPSQPRATMKMVATDDSLTFKISNRKNAAGDPLEDMDFEIKRVDLSD